MEIKRGRRNQENKQKGLNDMEDGGDAIDGMYTVATSAQEGGSSMHTNGTKTKLLVFKRKNTPFIITKFKYNIY